MLHIHVLLVAPLGVCHVAEPCADQHQDGVPIQERPHHTGPAADLTVQPLDHVVGADTRPVFAWAVAVGQRFFNAVLDLSGSRRQLQRSQFCNHGFCLLARGFLALLCVDCLEHFRYNFDLRFGYNRENIAVKMHSASLVFCIWEHLANDFQHSHALVTDDELHAV